MRQVYPWVVLDTLHRFRSAFPSRGRFFAAVSFFYLFMYSPTPQPPLLPSCLQGNKQNGGEREQKEGCGIGRTQQWEDERSASYSRTGVVYPEGIV